MRSAVDGPPCNQPEWSWAAGPASRTGPVAMGHALLCASGPARFGLIASNFFHFPDIFKSMQIQKFVQVWFEFRKNVK
jgi:hypothetical protein